MLNKINIPENLDLKYISVNNNLYFTLNNFHFCKVPSFLFFSIKEKSVEFFYSNDNFKKDFIKFKITFSKWLKKFNTLYVRKVLLKGLGLKVNFSLDSKCLELKLGFSHLIKIVIPTDKIKIKLIKNTISVSGFNLVTVGNFLYRIRSLKMPNIYKGKGIWYKSETRVLKAIKKT